MYINKLYFIVDCARGVKVSLSLKFFSPFVLSKFEPGLWSASRRKTTATVRPCRWTRRLRAPYASSSARRRACGQQTCRPVSRTCLLWSVKIRYWTHTSVSTLTTTYCSDRLQCPKPMIPSGTSISPKTFTTPTDWVWQYFTMPSLKTCLWPIVSCRSVNSFNVKFQRIRSSGYVFYYALCYNWVICSFFFKTPNILFE